MLPGAALFGCSAVGMTGVEPFVTVPAAFAGLAWSLVCAMAKVADKSNAETVKAIIFTVIIIYLIASIGC